MKMLCIIKNIDGGTGTYLQSIEKLKHYIPNLELTTLVLEKPDFTRRKYEEKIIYKYTNQHYKSIYNLSWYILWSFVCEVFWLRKNIKKYTPDIIISVDVHCNLLLVVSKLIFFTKPKLILTTHINLSQNIIDRTIFPLNFIITFCISLFYSQADLLIGVSKAVSQDLLQSFKLPSFKIITIYNGLPIPKDIAEKNRSYNNIIVRVGRLVEQKDDETLLRALAMLLKTNKNIQLWMIGDGPLKNEIKKRIVKYKLQDNVVMYGWKDNITKYLKKGDICVLSSKREGFSYILLEAMLYGLPVVATNCMSGPSEILEKGKYGILVPVGGVDSLQKALHTLVTNSKKYHYFSKQSLKRRSFFSEEKMLTHYKKVIHQLLSTT